MSKTDKTMPLKFRKNEPDFHWYECTNQELYGSSKNTVWYKQFTARKNRRAHNIDPDVSFASFKRGCGFPYDWELL